MNILTLKDGEVYLNGVRLLNCQQVDIKNINPCDPMEVVLHVDINEVDIQYSTMRKECSRCIR